MKVLQINSVCGIGSTGKIASDIHNILIEYGHESYIAFGRELPKNCDNIIRIGTKIDNYTHLVKTRLLDKHGFGSKQATIEFIEKVKELNPDIVHLHNIHGYYINIEILFEYLEESSKPVVWTLHDCWGFTGHCSHFDYIGCDKWINGCSKCPQKTEYPRSILVDNSEWNYNKKKEIFTAPKNLTIVTPSNWLNNLVKNSFMKNNEIVTIHNGIDLSIFKPTISDIRKKLGLEKKFIILGVSSLWTKKKGFDEYVELSQRLNEDEVIILVGVSDKQIKNLPNNIIGISKTADANELSQIYSSADVFVNLTLEDNYPTVNLEAIACGTPVITYDTGGSIESIDSKCGYIVEKKDINEIYNKVKEVKIIGKSYYLTSCLEHAELSFNKYRSFIKYIDLYEKVLK